MNKMKLIRIFAKNRLWSGRKPLWPRALPVLWAAALLLPAFAAQAGAVSTNLCSFPVNGASPQAALVLGTGGYFYGTTSGGGTYHAGTVFKTSSNGVLNTLYSFTGGNDGSDPNGLVQGSDSFFYDTTEYGVIAPGEFAFGFHCFVSTPGSALH